MTPPTPHTLTHTHTTHQVNVAVVGLPKVTVDKKVMGLVIFGDRGRLLNGSHEAIPTAL